ncbi:membrane protein [Citricoccus nitrophenolicus]
MAAALAGMGVLHFAAPRPFDGLIPRALPGPARAWTYGSGVAELAVAGLLAVPATRRVGGRAAQVLFLAVWPGNFHQAYRARNASLRTRAITLARLPLQVPLIAAAGRIAAGR